MKYGTNYKVATQWLNNALILCNNIGEVDNTIYENALFDWEDEDGNMIDIYQWYLTDCTQDDALYLAETFGLMFTYSEVLGVYVLCVGHFGTAWDYVYCETTNEAAARGLGERK